MQAHAEQFYIITTILSGMCVNEVIGLCTTGTLACCVWTLEIRLCTLTLSI